MARRKLDWLNSAKSLDDIASNPGADLHKLTGDLSGYYSIRVNNQFRIIFQWRDTDAFSVTLIDYH